MELVSAVASLLIVDSDEAWRRTLARRFQRSGMRAAACTSGRRALELVRSDSYDAIIFEWALPDMDGLRLCAQVRRERPAIALIVMTANDALRDKLSALEAGADDYLIKPIAFQELQARLRSILRRSQPPQHLNETAFVTPLRFILRHRERIAIVSGKPLDLTRLEARFLRRLDLARGQPVSRRLLRLALWGTSRHPGTNRLEVIVSELRRKLGSSRDLVMTAIGGYRLRSNLDRTTDANSTPPRQNSAPRLM